MKKSIEYYKISLEIRPSFNTVNMVFDTTYIPSVNGNTLENNFSKEDATKFIQYYNLEFQIHWYNKDIIFSKEIEIAKVKNDFIGYPPVWTKLK